MMQTVEQKKGKKKVANPKASFIKGYSKVPMKHLAAVRKEIMETLGVKTRAGWYYRIKGMTEPRVSEQEAIEAVFAKYGIKDIWGIE